MIAVHILVVVVAFMSMEAVAWFTHKYIMHGLLWILHKDHHKKQSKGFLEDNDFFFLIFAIPGMISFFVGVKNNFNYFFFVGLGITLYGIAYFLIHDVFIHQRFKIFRNANNGYLKGIRRAHKAHHKHLDKHDGECFGMLWVPMKYFKKTTNRSRA
jgi:beta-carotene 3-hydroxylase